MTDKIYKKTKKKYEHKKDMFFWLKNQYVTCDAV
jgi:hypothetical protein